MPIEVVSCQSHCGPAPTDGVGVAPHEPRTGYCRDSQLGLLQAQERERRRLAGELHDGLQQLLASLQFRIRMLQERSHAGPPWLATDVAGLVTLLGNIREEVQRMSHSLRPRLLEALGLPAAIRTVMGEFRVRTAIRTRLRWPDPQPELDGEEELTMFRVVQESLTNVEKHAGARAVAVCLCCEPDHFSLRVADNGRGLARGARWPGREEVGLGVVGMQERAAMLGGHLDIKSKPGGGTVVQLFLPRRVPA